MAVVEGLDALRLIIVGAAFVWSFYWVRFLIELRTDAGLRRLARDLASLEAKLREHEAVERARPFGPPVLPTLN